MTWKTDSEVYDRELKKNKDTSTQNLHTNFIAAILITKKAVTNKLNGTLSLHTIKSYNEKHQVRYKLGSIGICVYISTERKHSPLWVVVLNISKAA